MMSVFAVVILFSIAATSEKGSRLISNYLPSSSEGMYASVPNLGNSLDVPKHAVVYGDEWYCEYGYFLTEDNQCMGMSLPENALTDGQEWFCKDGYKSIGNDCLRIVPPANAFVYLDSWYCKSGYMPGKSGSSCILVDKPTEQKTAVDGKKYCVNGYKPIEDRCEIVKPPLNAVAYGTDWKCLNGYKKSGNECVAIQKPDHSQIYGSNWYCDAEYLKEGNLCVKKPVPSNAFLYDNKAYCYWEYEMKNGVCVKSDKNQAISKNDRRVSDVNTNTGDVVLKDVVRGDVKSIDRTAKEDVATVKDVRPVDTERKDVKLSGEIKNKLVVKDVITKNKDVSASDVPARLKSAVTDSYSVVKKSTLFVGDTVLSVVDRLWNTASKFK